MTGKVFSGPLMKQTARSNLVLAVVILFIMCLMSNVINFAASIMATDTKDTLDENVQEELFEYLFVLASYNGMTGSTLSYDDFLSGGDESAYDKAFDMYNLSSGNEDEMSSAGFRDIVDKVKESGTDADTYISRFEYVYALAGREGCFSGGELDAAGFMDVMLESAGISRDDIDKMQELDFEVYFNKIYFTVIGLLPIFVFIILAANSCIAAQVDKGSMAYILSTPTRRSAVALTQMSYMIIAPLVLMAVTCATRILSTQLIYGEVQVSRIVMLYLGMYLVTEAAAGICYLASCFFNQSQKALAAGGGITLWFFLAALLGMFGSEDMINMGIGTEVLGIFNRLTIVSLFDADAVQTVGTAGADYAFVSGFIILGIISILCYITGAVKFCRKDLPL